VEKNFVPVVIASSSGTAYSGTLLPVPTLVRLLTYLGSNVRMVYPLPPTPPVPTVLVFVS